MAMRQLPWLIERSGEICTIPLYGRIENGEDRAGHYNPMWVDWQVIVGVPQACPSFATEGTPSTTFACTPRAPPMSSTSASSTQEIMFALWSRKSAWKRSPRCFIHQTRPMQAKSFASSRNISWWLAPCVTPFASFAGICQGQVRSISTSTSPSR